MSTIAGNSNSPAIRAGKWLASLTQPDGSLAGATSINDYYKAVIGLAATGEHDASERMLDYVVAKFMKPDGDLDGTNCVWWDQFRIYPHAWLLMGAIARARFDLIQTWADFLETFQDTENGGFYGTLVDRDHRAEQEFMTTGVVAIALMWAGRTKAALKTGQWLRRILESQPDLSRGFYFVWNRQTGLVTDFPAGKSVEYRIDASQTAQWYFQFGIGAALSAGLYGVTKDREWLKLGRKYLDATKHCREDVFRQGTSGKIGWGSAWMYRVTNDVADRAICEKVYANLRDSQHAEGWWTGKNIYSHDWSDNPASQIDITGEFAALMSWMENALHPM